MKTSRLITCAAAALGLSLIVGCATPDSRIKESPDVFARLNPDQQALVKAGQIAIGFDKDAVRLALGDPERVTVQTTPAGSREVWHYITYEDYQGVVIYGGYWHRYRGWGGPLYYGGVPYYNGYPARVHEHLRVVFDLQGRVVEFEQEKP
jgi:outer membrane protein assembly factor BamE (lipoprotein component of BamABCDE complex)